MIKYECDHLSSLKGGLMRTTNNDSTKPLPTIKIAISNLDCGAEFRGDEIGQVCASGGMLPVSLEDPHLADELVRQQGPNF